MFFEGRFGVEALQGGLGDFHAVFFFDEVDDFVVDVVVEPGGDLEELVAGELGEAGIGWIGKVNRRERGCRTGCRNWRSGELSVGRWFGQRWMRGGGLLGFRGFGFHRGFVSKG